MSNPESERPTPTDSTPGHVFSMSPDSLKDRLTAMGEAGYRAKQILEWVYDRGVSSFEEMTNLSRGLRERLSREMTLYSSSIVRDVQATDGTRKLLLRWVDGTTTECVMIPDGPRRTACISTQVGCPVGCVFCASGLDGLERQLSAGEIVEQAMRARGLCGEERLSNVVFMGLGEPLHNYEATVAAVRAINAEWGLKIGARKITVSTVGLPKAIERLAEEKLQITLAISLHAPDDALRQQIIPWAASVSVDALVTAANRYFERTGREVTLEYILLGGLNDQPPHARALAAVAHRMRSNVNLIRYNPVDGLSYRRPTSEVATKFQEILRERGVNSHLRKSRGLDIDGACGQLRRRERQTTETVPLRIQPPRT